MNLARSTGPLMELSLDSLTLNDTQPPELIRAAQAHVADVFARFAEVAHEYGLATTLEPLASFATATMKTARRDALLTHLVSS
jgi:hypothetical protein